MGGSNKQTIGFKYFLGVHMVLAINKLRVLSVRFNEKTAWNGSRAGGGRISIHNPGLFGGKDKEGGVSGRIDILDGNDSQGVNTYLSAVIDPVLSAFRGVTSVVFRQFYFGNNPYLKKTAFKVVDDEVANEWLPSLARLNVETYLRRAEVYIALDVSGSMAGARFTYMKSNVTAYLESLKGSVNSVRIVAWSDNPVASVTLRDCDDSDYDTLKTWVNALGTPVGGTSFSGAVSLASTFFDTDPEGVLETQFADDGILRTSFDTGEANKEPRRQIMLFLTDGVPTGGQTNVDAAILTMSALPNVEVFCFNMEETDTQYTEQLDTSSADGVPVIQTSQANALLFSLQGPSLWWADLNAAHIFRKILTIPSAGNVVESVGATFAETAELFETEGMGLSFFWRGRDDIDKMRKTVQEHTDTIMYEDRATGLWELKPIRNDYVVNDLYTFDTSNVIKWHDDISKPLQKDLPNLITVVYTKRRDGSEGSVSEMNVAAVQQVNRVIPKKVTYEGVTTASLASRLALRDLAALTTPLLTGTITVPAAPLDLNLGSPFIVENSAFGIDAVVVRLTSREEVGGDKPVTVLKFIEDKFNTPATATVSVVDITEPIEEPAESTGVLMREATYYEEVLRSNAADVNEALTNDGGFGSVTLAGSRPDDTHFSVSSATNSGSGWRLVATDAFMPVSVLQTPVSSVETTVLTIDNVYGIETVAANTLCLIGNELMRVDDLALDGSAITLTVGRGCVDTAPAFHDRGEKVYFFDGFLQYDSTAYTAGEVISGKLLPNSSSGQLSLDDATTLTLTLDGRPNRPYPAGALKINADLSYNSLLGDTATVTWAHRDRTLQTTNVPEDFTYSDIGPETGVSYEVEVRELLNKENVFADADVFEPADIFLTDNLGSLVRRIPVGSQTTYNYVKDGTLNVFEVADVFNVTDVFAAVALSVFTGTDVFDTSDSETVFKKVGGRSIRTQFVVKSTRGAVAAWSAPMLQAPHLTPVTNLLLEVI